MKKLMIAFAAIAVAACAQAAQFYWQFGDMAVNNASQQPPWTYRTDAQELTGYTLYILNSTAWDSTDVAGSLDKALVTSEIKGTAAGGSWSTFAENAVMVNYASGAKKASGVSGLTPGSTFDAIIVVANGEKYWASDSITEVTVMEDGAIDNDYTPAALQLQNATAIMKDDMKLMAAVPEPTSGLLLLLGVAGLALRRRRA